MRAVHRCDSGQPRCLGALGTLLDEVDELLPWDAVVLADLEGLNGARVDEPVGFVPTDSQSVSNVLHAEDKEQSLKIIIDHSNFSPFRYSNMQIM